MPSKARLDLAVIVFEALRGCMLAITSSKAFRQQESDLSAIMKSILLDCSSGPRERPLMGDDRIALVIFLPAVCKMIDCQCGGDIERGMSRSRVKSGTTNHHPSAVCDNHEYSLLNGRSLLKTRKTTTLVILDVLPQPRVPQWRVERSPYTGP